MEWGTGSMKTKILAMDLACMVLVILSIPLHSDLLLFLGAAVLVVRTVIVYKNRKDQSSGETKE